jgi:hypothetical protein
MPVILEQLRNMCSRKPCRGSRLRTLHPFEELNEHAIGIGSEDRSQGSDRLRFPTEKTDAALSQSRCRRLDIGYTKREVIDTYMVRCQDKPRPWTQGPTTAPSL